MQDLFGSVLCSTPTLGGNDDCGGSRIAEKIEPCPRKLRLGLGFSPKVSPPAPLLPLVATKDEAPTIRWRKGELIGCGFSGHVYMGMNLDSGELLAVKQVLIGPSNASKEKTQDHKLEEEMKLLRNLSHPNIVRYLGAVREKEILNILLEFVPGGSISSLLGKFGSLPEAVIKMYTKQLLQGLEYLHKNGIMHRDIKGANILVDNKGCIKLADFGASKQVANLATMTTAMSMNGTPCWMAPEVIRGTGHTFSADIWSVGCTVIEMATGKPPWSEQYKEVSAILYYIGTTESHPPIPEHLSSEAKKFLLKCFQKKPGQRPSASDLLQHSFFTKDFHRSSSMEFFRSMVSPFNSYMKDLTNSSFSDVDCGYGDYPEQLSDLKPLWDTKTSDDMCQIFDKSFNPMSEPFADWPSNFDANLRHVRTLSNNFGEPSKLVNESAFPSEPAYEDDDEVIESKIRAFLDEKAFDLKKLQTPLYEFFSSLSAIPTAFDDMIVRNEYVGSDTKLPTKISKSFPSKIASHSSTTNDDKATAGSSRILNTGLESNPVLRESPSGELNELKGLLQDSQPEANNPRHRKWKEELDQELDREREILHASGVVNFSPLHRCASRKQDRKQRRMLFMSPGK